MIFNYTIYGNINRTSGYLTLKYFSYDLDYSVQKDFLIDSSGTYQFNLGDTDLLGLNYNVSKGDVCIIEYYDSTKEFSGLVQIDPLDNITEYNINVSSLIETTDIASFSISESLVKTTNHKVTQIGSLYNYFSIKDLTEDKVLSENNSEEFYFVPVQSHLYSVKQKALNYTSSNITEKEYIFNAIVSGASITRSNKCKSINDSIKILFMSNDIAPDISIYKDSTLLESSSMQHEGNLLFSYNFVFPSSGYYCFRIDYNDESHIVTFRVLNNKFKVYYIEENYLNESTNYNLYFVNDTNTIISTGSLTHIENGLYVSEELDVDYGDYMFEIKDDFFVTSFEECSGSSESSSSINNIKEEIYWIFPNNEIG